MLKIYPNNPNPKAIEQVRQCLIDGGVVVLPTDSVYAFACCVDNAKGIERIKRIKKLEGKNHQFSLIFESISQLSEYSKFISNSTFKLLKKNLPGAFTFILEANPRLFKQLKTKQKTFGARIPDNSIALEIVRSLGQALVVSSVRSYDEVLEYTTDPELIEECYGHQVDLIVDGGYGNNEVSTIVDCSTSEIEILREGIGILES